MRSGVDSATNFRSKVVEALYRAVDRVNPAWAREVARALTDQLVRSIDYAIGNVKNQVKSLTASSLTKIAGSSTATSRLLAQLKSTYQTSLQRVTGIGVPIWDADFVVSLGQDGSTSVADNSRSRFVLTVNSSPTVNTSH
jgi:hypothetical protein